MTGFTPQHPDGKQRYAKARAEYLPAVHPVVRRHPVTGKKILYVNPNFTDRIKGLSRNASDSLLKLLFALFEKPETQVRLRWDVDTVAIWDNRATVHLRRKRLCGRKASPPRDVRGGFGLLTQQPALAAEKKAISPRSRVGCYGDAIRIGGGTKMREKEVGRKLVS